MNTEINPVNAQINDLQGLEIETFKVEEIADLDVNAALSVDVTLCSSTTSSSCG